MTNLGCWRGRGRTPATRVVMRRSLSRAECSPYAAAAPWLLEDKVSVGHVDVHGGAVGVAALEQGERQGIADLALYHPLEGPRAKHRVVTLVGDPRTSLVGDFERQPPLGQPVGEDRQLDVDDLGDVALRQRPEPDDLVDAVDELGLEVVARVTLQVR